MNLFTRFCSRLLLTSNASDAIDDIINHLLADGIVATGVVVGGILLAVDQQLGVEELAVGASADLVDGRGVEVDKQGAGHVFAAAGLGEEGLVGAWVADVLKVGVGPAVRAQTVLEKVARGPGQPKAGCTFLRGGVDLQLPGAVSELGTSLAQVQVKDLS